ncbi:hypothetical protein [Chamaesiphon sp. GL140_3_metabinner_50]|uniref:hypothetical protein n=1 Tax=Chamaesiphon sp. GL140_3_metabinner_50 TaxID=2970812 RepID=UPI0025EB7C5D|nr:hypothetical protein [Chamaesiphon sp. GL140_3_metabinner_50]
MYQSSTRKNFLDTLVDPTTIAILASIGLHASIGAILPFFTQPDKEAQKAGPTTVKVVQLTPSELQRIPQAPQVPKPQVLPSARPIVPSRPAAAPPSTKFSTAPQTIPFSPQRPSDGTIFKAPTPKQKKVVPQKQPIAPDFDPENVFKPTTKPTPKVSPPVKPKPIAKKPQPVTPTPQPNTETDDDGGDKPLTTEPSPNPNNQAQQPAATPKPTPTSTPTPTTTPTPQPSGTPTGNNGGNGFYGKYTDAALQQLSLFMKEYDVKEPYPSKTITIKYPQGMLCGKEKQTPFIVLMAVLGSVPENPDEAILGSISADSLKIKTFTDRDTLEQRKLGEIASRAATEELSAADKNRPLKDKGKRVIYQYRVQFDPTTCKK